jgi:hypothetical protein
MDAGTILKGRQSNFLQEARAGAAYLGQVTSKMEKREKAISHHALASLSSTMASRAKEKKSPTK